MGRVLTVIIAAVIGAAIVLVGGQALTPPSPNPTAIEFAKALPGGNLTSLAVPSLLDNAGFSGSIAAWTKRDKNQSLKIEQGAYFADTVASGSRSATVDVVAHYAEVYPDGRALNWEQDYVLTLTRPMLGRWKVSNVRTTIQAVVQVLSSAKADGPTSLAVPVGIYLPTKK